MKKIFLPFFILILAGCSVTITMPNSGIVPVSTSTGALFSPTPTPHSVLNQTSVPRQSFSPPTVTASGSLSFRIPILMYHHIGTYPANADSTRKNLTVSTTTFEEHLKILQKKNYKAITLYDVQEFIKGDKQLPQKPIMLTFDDGYDDNFSEALPLLDQYGQKAVFYIATDLVGNDGYMTWEHVENLKERGHEIGSHTRTHADLKLISGNDKKLQDEVVKAKHILESKKLGPIISFCYPSGSYNEKVVDLVEEYYEFARTTKPGIFTQNSRRGELPTLRMQEGVDVEHLL